MSYDLYFNTPDAPLTREQFDGHFMFRRNYKIKGGEAWYENEDTGVYFSFQFLDDAESGEDSSHGAIFNINYYRPHFFGLEAAPEVHAFVERFRLKVHDPQVQGMGDGPYTQESFLRGWNAGNLFGYQAVQSAGSVPAVYPTIGLDHVWKWNIRRSAMQQQFDDALFVPRILFFKLDNRVITATVWGDAMPILLPKTDYVLVCRKQFAVHQLDPEAMETCVVPWHKLTPELSSFPVHQDPITHFELNYFEPPPKVIEIVQSQVASQPGVCQALRNDEVLNQEIVEKALAGA